MADVDMEEGPKDLLVLIWVHGFKGNDVTFESFPDRVSHLLRETHPSLRVESHVFPMYQTRGELKVAVLAFVDWLTELIVRLENDHGQGGGAGKAKIVLMGHSMGGLLIADAARDVVENTREGEPLWPKIVGILAFDTPYLGLHPHTFKHHLSQAASYYEQARSVASAATMLSPLAVGLGFGKWGGSSSASSTDEAGPSKSSKSKSAPAPAPSAKGKETASGSDSGASAAGGIPSVQSFWNKTSTLYGLGAVALGAAAAGTAYYRREDFMNGWKWGFDHMTFVRNLWDDAGMKERLDALDTLDKKYSIRFRNYYSHLPPSPPKQTLARTFTILPPTSHPTYPQWIKASNNLASDEVSAHMGMFNPKTNDGFYELGLEVVHDIGERIEEEGVGRARNGDGMGDRFSVGIVDGDEKDGWREEKDSQGRIIWVET